MIIYLKLSLVFLKIGALTFGGGLAMLPWIQQEINKFYYISNEEFANLVALSQITPGPIGVNAATFVGYDIGGLIGALISTLAVALPSFIFMNIVIKNEEKFNKPFILKGFVGIKSAVVGMIYSASFILMKSSLINENVGLCPIRMSRSFMSFDLNGIFVQVSNSINILGFAVFLIVLFLIRKTNISIVKILSAIIVFSIIISLICQNTYICGTFSHFY